MATASKPRLDLLQFGPIWIFGVLGLFWLASWALPPLDANGFRLVARLSGYLAAATMVVPYLHVARRFFRYRDWGRMRTWLRWHIGCAYASGFFLLLHCQARAHASLTLAILLFFWVVMLSGAVGFYGQKVLYRLLPLALDREVGLERMEPERERLLKTAAAVTLVSGLGGWKDYERRGTAKSCPALSRLIFDPFKPAEKRELVELAKGAGTAAQEVVFLDRVLALLANDEFLTDAALLTDDAVADWPALIAGLGPAGSAHAQLGQRLSKDGAAALEKLAATPADPKAKNALLKALNEIVKDPDLAAPLSGGARTLDKTVALLAYDAAKLSPGQAAWRNRLLLEALLPGELIPRPAAIGSVVFAQRETDEGEMAAVLQNRRLVAVLGGQEIAEPVEKFWEEVVSRYLRRPLPGWGWIFGLNYRLPVSGNAFDRVKAMTPPAALPLLERLESLVDERRQLDLEFSYHRLGRLWLLFHGPASAALFILAVDHIWMSVWYGGW